MSSSRHYVVLLAAIVVSSLLAVTPCFSQHGDWSRYEPEPFVIHAATNGVTLSTATPYNGVTYHRIYEPATGYQIPAAPDVTIIPMPSISTTPTGPGYYEAYIILKDTSLPASASKELVTRRLAYLVNIAQSGDVWTRTMTEVMTALHDNPWTAVGYPKVEPLAGTRTIRVSAQGKNAGHTATRVALFARQIIAQCQEMDGTPNPQLESVGQVHTRTVKRPVLDSARTWLRDVTRIGRPRVGALKDQLNYVLNESGNALTSRIEIALGVLLGLVIGAFMGRRRVSPRYYAVLAGLVVLSLSVAWISTYKECDKLPVYSAATTLICKPASSSGTPAELVTLAKSKTVLDGAVLTLEWVGIPTTVQRIRGGLEVRRRTDSDLIWIETRLAARTKPSVSDPSNIYFLNSYADLDTQLETSAVASAVAYQTIKRYDQLHPKDASANPVQILDRSQARILPLPNLAETMVRYGIPVSACLLVLLIVYPISYRIALRKCAAAAH